MRLTRWLAKSDKTSPANAVRPVTKANADLPDGVCRGITVGTAGTLNFVDGSGEEHTGYPAQQGYNPIVCQQIRTGGTADNIWALY